MVKDSKRKDIFTSCWSIIFEAEIGENVKEERTKKSSVKLLAFNLEELNNAMARSFVNELETSFTTVSYHSASFMSQLRRLWLYDIFCSISWANIYIPMALLLERLEYFNDNIEL